jgi:hypothetical protein
MRSAVGIFGLLCGAVVIWTVANYGFASADDPAAKWNMAFLFAVIAAGGLFGHAVAVRIWRISKGFSILIGIACAGALIINLSNSLGALAGRASRSAAEASTKTAQISDDRAELKRLESALAQLGTFTPTDEAAVGAAKRAADAATTAKNAECGNGDPKQRGRFCRDKETAEKEATDALAKTSATKAITDRANRIEAQMAPIRKRLQKASPIAETNVQGWALAKLFRLPEAEAGFMATVQQFGLAAIVEALIVLSMVAYELIGQANRLTAHSKTEPELRVEPVTNLPEPEIVKLPEMQPPKLIASSAERSAASIPKILTAALERAGGERVEMADVYRRYRMDCAAEEKRALPPEQFVDPLARFCKAAGIRTKATGEKVYLMNVRLVAAETLLAPSTS